MKNKTTWIVVILIVIIGALVLFGGGEKEPVELTGEPIKIGNIAALTGVGTAIGEEENKGAKLAVKEINENGGVLGRPLELVSEDLSIDKLKNSASVANKLINVDKVVGIVGPQWDEPAIAILPIVEEAKVPMIGPDTTDTIEVGGLGDYLFSTWYDNRVGIDVILDFAEKKGWKTGVVLRSFDAGFWKFASDLVVSNAPQYEIEIVSDMNLNNPLTSDFRTFLSKIKDLNPDFVFFVTSDPTQCVFFKQMKELGIDIPVLATESSGNNASLEQCPEVMDNLFFSTPMVFHDRYQEFEEAFVGEYGRKPLFPSAVTSYDAVRILAYALEKTGGTGGEELKNELDKIKDFPGASLPKITFNEKGFVMTPPDTFKIQTIKNSEFVEIK